MRGITTAALAAMILLGVAAPGWSGEPVVYREVGKASYYGYEFVGQRTASGVRYDPRALTAAHPTLPLGTEVTVVALDTGKQVTVRINDRGPYAQGRKIDLSLRAAQALGIVDDGVARVRITATEDQLARGKVRSAKS
ncbi:MAG: septal ring lytic transglycosylase RlpA family protein [Geminicoccaceae bacterium]